MAHVIMAHVVMAHVVMACVFMAYVLTSLRRPYGHVATHVCAHVCVAAQALVTTGTAAAVVSAETEAAGPINSRRSYK